MSTKKIPQRQCIGCGEMKNKKEMIRILKTTEEQIELDATGRKNGRGAYLCPSMDCYRKAVKSRGLERSLKMAIPKDVFGPGYKGREDGQRGIYDGKIGKGREGFFGARARGCIR